MSWKLVPISKVVTKCSTWNPITVAGGDFLYVDLSSIDKEKKIINPYLVNYTECQNAPSRARQIINNGDVLVATVRPNLNAVALVNQSFDGATASTGYCVLRPKPDLLLSEYLYYWVQTTSFIDDMTSKATGANYPAVSDKIIKESFIPLPPLAEQKRIAAILDKADAIRQKRQKAIELADEFLRSVFLDMFGDPVTNPKGWEVEALSSLIHIQGGYAFKSTDFGSEGIPVVKIGNANKKGFTAENIDFIQPELPEKLKQYELFPGDLLMSLTGTVGKDDYGNITEVTDEYNKYYLNQRVAKLSIKSSKINKDYFNFCLSHQSMKNELIKNNRGVRQANINNSDIYELEIPVADINAQNNFSEVVGKMKSIVQSLIKTEPLINNTFFSLSQKAFSGEL